ncbi:MAG: hypothetical protein ACJAQT_003876 [Akkermansiaceae bacterium]|jgi:hypothetical protein
MSVFSESLIWGNRIIIDDAEGLEAGKGGIIVISKGEGVPGIEPAVIRMEAIIGPADLDVWFDLRCHGLFIRRINYAG